MACHDATEAFELSLSDMQIPLILNHSEAVVIKTKHRLKAINRTIKQLYPFKHKIQIEIELQCSFKPRNAMDTG